MKNKRTKIILIAALVLVSLSLLNHHVQFFLGGAMINIGYRFQDHLKTGIAHSQNQSPEKLWSSVKKQNKLASSIRKMFPRTVHIPKIAILLCMDARLDDDELTGDTTHEHVESNVAALRNAEPIELVKYRLVIATTGEYAQFHGGTKPLVAAELITAVNRINAVLIKDMGIQLELVAQNDKVIFLDPGTDGYSNGDTELMIDQNPVRIGLQIPLDNYDIGHVFGLATNGQVGLAQLGSVCTNSKARGVSGLFTPKFDPFYIGVICHEMGHQFSATHSFNKCSNENPGTGWEPGGGSTIMSYSGACGTNSIKNNADDYYHGGSLGQMKNFIRTGSGAQCGQKIPTSNHQPLVNFTYKNGFYIPISTPFKLTASGTDEEGNSLTFCWEGMDTGPITDAGDPVQTSPLFRTFPPVADSMRVFPRMSLIVQKQNNKFEVLPDYSREMSFRVTVRDNNSESGSIAQKDLLFNATEFAGPFTVTSFSTIDTVR